MKTLLQNINELDFLIRQLEKMASRLQAGQIIDAWRECNGLISHIKRIKQDVIKESEQKSDK